MNEKELIKKLNSMKDFKADDSWKKNNRQVLLSQISNSISEEKNWCQKIETKLRLPVWKLVSQPAMVVLLICAVVLSGGIFSLQAAKDTKPGDSLYIAKIVSEKAQIAFTFDDKKKAQLNLRFASNRAREISQIMEGNNSSNETVEKNEKVKKLMDNFKREITSARSVIEKMSPSEQGENNLPGAEDSMMFSANVGKDSQGIEVSGEINIKDNIEEGVFKIGSSTPTAEVSVNAPEKVLQEAEKMLIEEDYEGMLSKLDEVDEIIKKAEDGNKAASSSPAVDAEQESVDKAEADQEGSVKEGSVLGVEEVVENATTTDQ